MKAEPLMGTLPSPSTSSLEQKEIARLTSELPPDGSPVEVASVDQDVRMQTEDTTTPTTVDKPTTPSILTAPLPSPTRKRTKPSSPAATSSESKTKEENGEREGESNDETAMSDDVQPLAKKVMAKHTKKATVEDGADQPPVTKKAKRSADEKPTAASKKVTKGEDEKKISTKKKAAETADAKGSNKEEKSDSKSSGKASADVEKVKKSKLEFVAFPSFPNSKASAGEMVLPEVWQPWPKRRKKGADGGADSSSKPSTPQKKAKTSEEASPSKKESEAAEAAKEKKRLEKEKEKKRVQETFDRLAPDGNLTSQESFEKLVSDILLSGKSFSSESRSEMAAYCQWEIPYIAHFTWLFQKPLNMRPLEPQRLEQILLQPNHLLNESTFSELVSKLLFSTRLHYTSEKYLRRGFTQMGRSQRVFQYDLLAEWMFWLVEIWIEQWKQHVKQKMKEEEDDDSEGEDGEEAAASSSTSKKSKKGKKTHNDDEGEEDEDNSEEDEEEKEAYNIHLIPEKKWRVNTEELFGNVNPFTDPKMDEAEAKEAAKAAAEAAAAAAATSSSSDDAAAAVSSSSSCTPPPARTLPKRRKEFHEISLLHRCALLRLLCDFQLHVNPNYISALKEIDGTEDLRILPLGSDQTGKKYYWFRYPDYRIYVQGTSDLLWQNQVSKQALNKEGREDKLIEDIAKESFNKDHPEVKAAIERLERKRAAHAQKELEEAQQKTQEALQKALKKKSQSADDDTPLSMLLASPPPPAAATPARPAPVSVPSVPPTLIQLANWTNDTPKSSSTPTPVLSSSLERLPSPVAATPASSDAATAISSADAATASSSSIAGTAAAPAAFSVTFKPAAKKQPTEEPTPGFPFRLKTEEEKKKADEYVRPIYCVDAPQPSFSLLTHSAAQMKSLIDRLKSAPSDHPRSRAVAAKLQEVLDDHNEGRHRQIIEEEAKGGKAKGKERAEPKRVSDRLVGLEAQREEAERLRIQRAEEDSRLRYTRRNKLLDRLSQRNINKVRKSFQTFTGIQPERKPKDSSDEDENGSDSSSSSAHPSSSDSETDDESGGGRRRVTRGTKQKKTAHGRNTRNHGRSKKSLKELSETESEQEEVSDDDEGCTICNTIVPPEDGSNPILLCDGCDLQYCLKWSVACITYQRAYAHGSFIAHEC